MVEKEYARQQIISSGVPPNRVVALDTLPAGALNHVLLAVFQGCYTGYYNATWGSPTDGAYARGVRCSVGFRSDIYSHDTDPAGNVIVPGAEEWAHSFWAKLRQGRTVSRAATEACSGIPVSKGLGLRKEMGPVGSTQIHPSRYAY